MTHNGLQKHLRPYPNVSALCGEKRARTFLSSNAFCAQMMLAPETGELCGRCMLIARHRYHEHYVFSGR